MSEVLPKIRVPLLDTPQLLGRVLYIMANFPELTVMPIRTAAHKGGKPYPAISIRCQVPLDCGFTLNDLIQDIRAVINDSDNMWTSFAEFDKETSKTYLKVKIWL